MAKYYRRPDGLYETSRTINGKRVKFRGRSCQEVDRKILEYNIEKKKGRKMPEIIDEWFAGHERKIKYSTQRTYGYAVKRIKEAFATFHAGEIRPLDIDRYISRFEAQGYALNTVEIELSVVKQIFAYAVIAGDIDVSPATEISHGKNLPRKKRNSLTEEQELSVETCRKGRWWLMGLMLLYTGMRRGELLALNWQDVDRREGVIHVNKKLNYAFGNIPHLEDELKSENGLRDIPLLDPLRDALPQGRIGLIFTNDAGTYLSGSQLNAAWREYCRDANLTEWFYDDDGKPEEAFLITPHCFRHSFSTICYESGLDPKDTASIVGDTEQVVNDVYTDLRKRRAASNAEKLNNYVVQRRQGKAEELG